MASVDGSFIGRGATVIIFDDPLDMDDADNAEKRDKVNRKFDTAILSRLNNAKEGRVIINAHRLHEDDLSGHVLKDGGWDHLVLPFQAPRNQAYPYEGRVWHRKKGELLRPDAFSNAEVARVKSTIKPPSRKPRPHSTGRKTCSPAASARAPPTIPPRSPILSADSAVKAGEANVALVQDALSYTELKSEAAGLITQRLGEVGQVVAPAQTIFTLAQDGDRDAVFNVFESLLAGNAKDVRVDVSLVSDPKVTTTATVREVAPSVDPVSGTVQVKLALASPPPAMTLGRERRRQGALSTPRGVPASLAGAHARGRRAGGLCHRRQRRRFGARRQSGLFRHRLSCCCLAACRPARRSVTAGVQLLRPGMHVTVTDAAP